MKALRIVLLAAPAFAPALFASDTAAPAPSVPVKTEAAAKPAPRRSLVQLASDKRALATRLVESLKLREQMEANLVDINRSLDGSFEQVLKSGPAGAQKELVEQYRARVHKLVNDTLVWDKVSGEVIQAYSGAYSEQELKDINGFFSSPAGRALTAKAAEVSAAVGGISRKRMDSIQPQIQSAIYEMSLEIQRRSGTAATSTPGGE